MPYNFSNSEKITAEYPVIKARLEAVREEYNEAHQWVDNDYELDNYRMEIEILSGIINIIDAAYAPHYFDNVCG